MNYIIIEKIDPASDPWQDYLLWSGLNQCREFYSIDSIVRPSQFTPVSDQDWAHCVNADFKLQILTCLDYARSILPHYPGSEIVGVIEDPLYNCQPTPPHHHLLGYDILDVWSSISLLTNWGGKDSGIKHLRLNEYALLDDIHYAYGLKAMLRKDYADDSHAEYCEVWAVYKVAV